MRVPLTVAAVLGIVVVLVAALTGLWWMPMAVGLVCGIVVAVPRDAVAAAGLSGVLGWGLGLAWQQVVAGDPIGPIASLVSDTLHIGASGGLILVLATLFYALALSVSGVWVGTAARITLLPRLLP